MLNSKEINGNVNRRQKKIDDNLTSPLGCNFFDCLDHFSSSTLCKTANRIRKLFIMTIISNAFGLVLNKLSFKKALAFSCIWWWVRLKFPSPTKLISLCVFHSQQGYSLRRDISAKIKQCHYLINSLSYLFHSKKQILKMIQKSWELSTTPWILDSE